MLDKQTDNGQGTSIPIGEIKIACAASY